LGFPGGFPIPFKHCPAAVQQPLRAFPSGYRLKRGNFHTFFLTGRISVNTSSNSKEKTLSTKMTFSQSQSHATVPLMRVFHTNRKKQVYYDLIRRNIGKDQQLPDVPLLALTQSNLQKGPKNLCSGPGSALNFPVDPDPDLASECRFGSSYIKVSSESRT
jgi:hypothetical protein